MMDRNLKTALFSLLGGCLLMALLVVASSLQKPLPPQQDTASAGLNKPRGVAVDGSGRQYVVDSRNHRIEIRDKNGALIKRFGKKGTGDSQFTEPCGIALDKQGNVYVADTFYSIDPKGGLPWGRVEKFSPEGVFMSSWGRGPAQGDLFGPRDLAVDAAGNVYLSDTGNGRIVKYGPDGSFKAQWGKKGRGKGEFDEPFGLAVDQEGLLYVADRRNYRIQVFSSEGKFVRGWPVDGWEKEAQVYTQVNVEPYLAIDQGKGLIYVSDPTKMRVQRFDLKGRGHKEYLKDASGQTLDLPTGLAVQADGSVLVTCGGTNRLQVLKP
jgi:DNA-binding beta-propeller fold protein YncE